MDVRLLLHELKTRRPIFHAEADFQHALAWAIHERHPEAAIRLEMPFESKKGRIYLDLWIGNPGAAVGIELKYRTRGVDLQVAGEAYRLKDHGAPDFGRYDFLADLQRIEALALRGDLDSGHVVMLTNDPAYWTPSPRSGQQDAAFRIHEGRTVEGTLSWAPHTPTWIVDQKASIEFDRSYTVHWSNYSVIDGHSFRYCLIGVDSR